MVKRRRQADEPTAFLARVVMTRCDESVAQEEPQPVQR